MIQRNTKKLWKLLMLIMVTIALYSWVGTISENSFMSNFSTGVAVPVLFTLFNEGYRELNKYSNTLQLAEETKKLFDMGIINEKERDYRIKLIVELENNKIRRNHKYNKELESEISKYINCKS